MSTHCRTCTERLQHSFAARRVSAGIVRLTSGSRCQCLVPIEVLTTGFYRRCLIQIRLRCAIRKLQRVMPSPLPLDVAVVVQQIIMAERQLPGCYQISQRPDGSRLALIRLALPVDGRLLSADELLAVLAEQYIALAMQQHGPSLLVPIDLAPAPAPDDRPPAVLRPDPLRQHRDFGDHGA